MSKALEYLLSRPLLCTIEAADVAASIVSRDGDGPELVAARKGVPVDGTRTATRRDGVAVIPVCGPISRYATMMEDICGGVSVESLARELRTACEDPSVSAIVLDIDSPGGEANGIGELAGQIRAANGVKPVCAYVGGSGCSAAYWLAAAAGEVVCSESAELGSVGAVMGMTVKSDRPGTKSYKFISSQSPLKHADPATESGKNSMQSRCDALAGVFVSAVGGLRGVGEDHVLSHFGKGGVLTGRAAVDAGMADCVGDFEGTLARLARGERLVKQSVKPKPKPGVKATADSTKGISMANPFGILARLFTTHPDAVTAAMADESTAADPMADFLAKLSPAPVRVSSTQDTPPVDADAIRKQVEAEFTAKAADAAKATVTGFFEGQAKAFFADAVKVGLVTPADVANLTARYVDAALADHAAPLVLVAADGTRTPVSRLSFVTDAVTGSKSKARWTEELVSRPESEQGDVLPAVVEASEGDSEARIKSMLSATPEGRAILAAAATAKAAK